MNNTFSINNYFNFYPTDDQKYAFQYMKSFVKNETLDVLIMSGAAGTGKTSMMIALKKYLQEQKVCFTIIAPTHRASRVIGKKVQWPTSTIHQLIYDVNQIKDEEGNVNKIEFVRKNIVSTIPYIFIVDEASMISDVKPSNEDEFASQNSVLFDLINYVKTFNSSSKIIFIGDSYQLPPVKSNFSPALMKSHLEKQFGLNVSAVELKEVKRQKEKSTILDNAIMLRKAFDQKHFNVKINSEKVRDYDSWINSFCNFYLKDSQSSVILSWKNDRVREINMDVRNKLFNNPIGLVCIGEQLISSARYVGSSVNFPNNTFLEVCEVSQVEENIAGFRFVDVRLKIVDDNLEMESFVKLRLNDLIENDDFNSKNIILIADRMKQNKKFRESKNIMHDPYLSAVKAKYAYALTVHKSQGGEWKNVFLFPDFPFGQQKLNWLYTAVTRASNNLYSFDNNLIYQSRKTL
ncbi:MAG: DEAD/DEAH box helicase [Bacteroidales bacterium]|nr:DEAD/DEAH box helicase [Bacteroidales bacterium]